MRLEDYKRLAASVLTRKINEFNLPESELLSFIEKDMTASNLHFEDWFLQHNLVVLKYVTNSQLGFISKFGKTFWETK